MFPIQLQRNQTLEFLIPWLSIFSPIHNKLFIIQEVKQKIVNLRVSDENKNAILKS